MMIPADTRPSREASMFLDFLEGVSPWRMWVADDEGMPGARKTLRHARSKFLSMICQRGQDVPRLRWSKRTLRSFRRETWEPWLRASVSIEIERARLHRACKNPKIVPREDIALVRRRWNYDPLSKQSVYG